MHLFNKPLIFIEPAFKKKKNPKKPAFKKKKNI